jgi:alkanesulfonate monooxygenase SsuD/methylene tetrahydromethanopterin reductase-like flavin-dependent oxidoreductase (luciferase family)
VGRSWSGGCACAPPRAAAEALTGGWSRAKEEEAFDCVGTPAQVAEQMRPFIDLGVNYFILAGAGFPRLTTLEVLIDAVLPAVNA